MFIYFFAIIRARGIILKKVEEIPSSFLMEIPLSKRQEEIFIKQINLFNDIKEMDISLGDINLDDDGRVLLEEGMLIHGTHFRVPILDNIIKTGILSGQAIGIYEDGETYYCADFHRVTSDMSMKEYSDNFIYRDDRCPFGNGIRGASSLAFIVNPVEEAKELLSYDCYRDGTVESVITKSFTNEAGLLPYHEKLSSILYGVPSNLICGIVLGNKLLEKKEILQLVIRLYPNCFVSTIDGVVIYNPKVDKEYSELIALRAQNYVLSFEKSLVEEKLTQRNNEIRDVQARLRSVVEAMIMECPASSVAPILLENHLSQGSIDSVLESINRKKRI